MKNKFNKFLSGALSLSFFVFSTQNVGATSPKPSENENLSESNWDIFIPQSNIEASSPGVGEKTAEEDPQKERISKANAILSPQKIVLIKFIASGGNGAVYSANHEDKIIAIKMSKTESDITLSEKLKTSPIAYEGCDNSEENTWLDQYCVLPTKINISSNDNTMPFFCSMPLAEHDLTKSNTHKTKYNFQQIAFIIRDIVRAFEALRMRGYCHNDISLGNILKIGENNYRLSDFGAIKEVLSEEEGKISISNSIKTLVELLNSSGFSKGLPQGADQLQKNLRQQFSDFCKEIKAKNIVSAEDVLTHPYIISATTDQK